MSTFDTPLETGDTGFWLTDRNLRASLHQAVEDLMGVCAWAVRDDVTFVEALRDLAAGICQGLCLDAIYVPLVQAHAAIAAAEWASCSGQTVGPLDPVLLEALDDFLTCPQAVQAHILEEYEADEQDFVIEVLPAT